MGIGVSPTFIEERSTRPGNRRKLWKLYQQAYATLTAICRISPGKPTFLRKERWKAIQKARRKGMSLRAIKRDLGINRATVRNYLDSVILVNPLAGIPRV